jgi:hypothetical protein
VGVVGVAVAGSIASSPSVAVVEASLSATPAPTAASHPVVVEARRPLPRPALKIVSPSRDGAVITTPALIVRGSRSGPAGPTQVTLLAEGTALARQTLPANGAGGAFQIELPVPGPRPGGSMVVEVVAFTTAVRPIRTLRIPVQIGAVVEGAPRTVGRTGEGPIGEDGIVGGIVFGNAWDPEALGTPAP